MTMFIMKIWDQEVLIVVIIFSLVFLGYELCLIAIFSSGFLTCIVSCFQSI